MLLAVGEALELEVAAVEADPRQRRGRWTSGGGRLAPVPAHGGEADAVLLGRQPAEDDAGEAASSDGRSNHAGVGDRMTQMPKMRSRGAAGVTRVTRSRFVTHFRFYIFGLNWINKLAHNQICSILF